MPFFPYREELVEMLESRLLAENPEVQKGKMFGQPGFHINKRFFCFAYDDGISMKLSKDDYAEILALEEARKFSPKGSPMGTWAVLTYPESEEYYDHWEWLEKAMAYIVTDEAAPPKKKKKK